MAYRQTLHIMENQLRIPLNDDWDDALNGASFELERATDKICRAIRILKDE